MRKTRKIMAYYEICCSHIFHEKFVITLGTNEQNSVIALFFFLLHTREKEKTKSERQ